MQQLEKEVKLEVGPGWTLPDLTGLFPGVRAVPLPTLALDAVYYDTADSRLAQHHITLRVRREVLAGVVGGTNAARGTAAAGTVAAGTTKAAPPKGAAGVADGAATGTWTIKLPSSAPSDGTVLVRTEVTWPATESRPGTGTAAPARPRPGRGRAATSPFLPPHPEAVRFLRAVTLGLPLAPVARLSTIRDRTELRTSDGRNLAEIDHDSVTGRAFAHPGDGTGRSARDPGTDQEVRFVEVEVELAEGSSQEVLDAVAHRLAAAGARPSSRQSKVATVLRMAAAPTSPAGLVTPAGLGTPGVPADALDSVETTDGQGGGVRRAHALMSGALAEQARECLGTLVDHDPAIRLGDPDPEHVHQARVGARRLRSILRSFAPLVVTPLGEADDRPETWFGELRDELKWLAGALGAVRDADVRLQGLVQECSTLPSADNLGVTTLLAVAEDDQVVAHEVLREAMDSERYVELLRSLEGLAYESCPPPGDAPASPASGDKAQGGEGQTGSSSPAGNGLVPEGLWARLARPASAGLPALAHRQWRAVRRAVRRLGDEPADTALHQVRIQAKRLRYLSDVAALFVAPAAHRADAKAMSKAASRLQDVLGELHDSAVTEQWLRDGAARVPSGTRPPVAYASGLAAGELVARAQGRQRALRKKWPDVWAPLRSPKLHRWMAP